MPMVTITMPGVAYASGGSIRCLRAREIPWSGMTSRIDLVE
jgi:hypothetical protein